MAPDRKTLFSLGLLLASAASTSTHARSSSPHRLFARQQSADPAATGDASTGSLLEAIIPAECSQACQQLVQATNACLDGADLTCACNTETVSGFVTCATCAPAIYQGESDSLRSAVEQALQQCQAAGSPVDYDPSQVPAGSGSSAGQGSAINTDSLASNSVDDSPSSSSSSGSLTLIAPTTAASSGATLVSPTTPASSPAAGIGARPITSTASVPPLSSAAANGNATETAADDAGGAFAAVKMHVGLAAAMVVAVIAALA